MRRISGLLMLMMAVILPLYAQRTADFSLEDMPDTVEAGRDYPVHALIYIAPGWHINAADPGNAYAVATELILQSEAGVILSDPEFPKGNRETTSWGENLYLYDGLVRVPVTLSVPAAAEGEIAVTLSLKYQACNDASCLAPETVAKEFIIYSKSAPVLAAEHSHTPQAMNEEKSVQNKGSEIKEIPSENAEGPFEGRSMIWVLLTVFVLGLGLNLTPCVYPLIPITMGFFISQKGSRSPVGLAIAYVIGLAITYSILGTLAALGGSMMGSLLANPITLVVFALIMIALSLSMFGLYEFKLPDKLVQGGGGSQSGIPGALIMGLTMGIVAAPCVGPFVVSLLAFVAQQGSALIGFITFFFLALGLGVPYLFLGIFSAKIDNLPRSGEWLNGIRVFFGLALIAMAIYFIQPLLSSALQIWVLPVYMIAAAFYYGVFDRSGQKSVWFLRLKTFLSMAVLAVALVMLLPSVSPEKTEAEWQTYSQEALLTARFEDRPVVIDFYADWCNPCKELDHITFSDARVTEALEDFTLLKVDLTTSDAFSDSLRKAYDISGVPTILFLNGSGEEVISARLSGFEKPGPFLQRLESLK